MNPSESETEAKLVLAKNLNFSDKKMKILESYVKEVLIYNKKYTCSNKGFY